MHIYFINPPFKAEYGKFSRESRSPAITKSGALYYPLWLIYAAAYASKYGHDIDFLDPPAKPLDEQASMDIIAKNIQVETTLFVLNTSTPSIMSDVAFAAKIKAAYPKSFILLVGTHPTACPKETLGYSASVDGVGIGEYDEIVRQLADALQNGTPIQEVKGLYINTKNGIISTGRMPAITNMDDMPFAAEFIKKHLCERDYFFAAATYPSIQIFTGRGCPCHCNFCVYPQTMHGHVFRARTAENVVQEFQFIADNFPDVHEVVIEDDTFTVNKQRVKVVCTLLIQRGLNKGLN